MKNLNLDRITERLPKINEKNQYYFLGGILLIFFLVDYFLIMQPQLRTLRTLNPKITLLSDDLKSAKNNIARLAQFQGDLQKFKDKAEKQTHQVIAKEEVPMLLENISRMANKVGVTIDQIMPLKESQELALTRNEGKYFYFPILINARGGYHNMGRFINLLESDEVFLNIEKLDLSANSEGSSPSGRITVSVVIFEPKGS